MQQIFTPWPCVCNTECYPDSVNTVLGDMKKTRKIVTFEPEKDVAKMLKLAQDGGLRVGQILNDSLRAHGPKIIRESAKRQAGKLLELSTASFPDAEGQNLGVAA